MSSCLCLPQLVSVDFFAIGLKFQELHDFGTQTTGWTDF